MSGPCRLLGFGALAAVHALCAPAAAQRARDFESLATEPAAVPGGVLMLPLAARTPGRDWPTALELELEDGQVLSGAVAWLEGLAAEPGPRSWTDARATLRARPIRPEDDTAQEPALGRPFLLAELPRDAHGLIRLGGQVLSPQWIDPAPASAAAPPLPLDFAADRPDPDAPFEHWRWVLLADELGLAPPSPDRFAAAEALIARHYAELWRAGLARLEVADGAVARACRRQLLLRATDRGQRVAAWTTNAEALAALLQGLLDPARGSGAISRAAANWVAVRPRLLVWLERTDDRTVELVAINRTTAAIAPRVEWSDGRELPIAVELEPGRVTRIVMDRPDAGAAAPPALPPDLLLIEEGQAMTLPIGPGRVPARPPGLTLRTARPPLTLSEVEGGGQRPVAPDRATTVELRRRAGRWEVFVECRRPQAATAGPGQDQAVAAATSWRDLAGAEAITLLFGSPGAPRCVLAVPETGWHRLLVGTNDGTLQVHRGRFADRWYARIVVPEAWIGVAGGSEAEVSEAWVGEGDPRVGRVLRLGAVRTHGSDGAVETLPFTSAPWRQRPGAVVAELGAWPR